MSDFDFAEVCREAEEIRKNNGTGDFPKIPVGNYEVTINKIAYTHSKNTNTPMLTIWFKIIEGQYKNQKIFFNQPINTGNGMHHANEMLRSFDTGLEISYTNEESFKELLAEVEKKTLPEDVSFELELGSYTSKKDGKEYPTYKIVNIFDAE